MTLHSHSVLLYLWCAQPFLQSVVAVILWRRKLHKQFLAFQIFLLAQVVIFALIFPSWILGNYEFYFDSFWICEAINACLGFKVIHEIFLDVFRPYHTLKDLGTLLFKWAGLVMLLVSVVVAFSNSFDHSPLIHAITTLQRSVRIVQVGLILFLLLFSGFLGVSKRQMGFGISLGFGLFAGGELMLMALHSGGFLGQDNLNLINLATYNLAIFIWLGYSVTRQSIRKLAVNPLQTQRWEQGLADLQSSLPTDSLIPMFEGMVERAFSRNSDLESVENSEAEGKAAEGRANSAAAGSKTQS